MVDLNQLKEQVNQFILENQKNQYMQMGMMGFGALSSLYLLKKAKNAVWSGDNKQQVPSIKKEQHKRYIVIYGAGSKIGQAYAKFLQEKGFGLILIDMSEDRLKQAESMLHENIVTELSYKMITVEPKGKINEKDFDEILKGVTRFSIDCIINAYSLFKPRPKSGEHKNKDARDSVYENFQAFAQYEMMRQLFQNQAETFAQIIQYLHKRLLLPPLYTSIINVKRKERNDEQGISFSLKSEQICKIFYQTSSGFNKYFSFHLGQRFRRKIKAISVKMDFNRSGDEQYMRRKVIQSFKILNYHL